MNFDNHNIELNSFYYNNINNILSWYITKIRKEFENNFIPPFRYEDYLIIISEILPIVS